MAFVKKKVKSNLANAAVACSEEVGIPTSFSDTNFRVLLSWQVGERLDNSGLINFSDLVYFHIQNGHPRSYEM